MSKYVHGRVRLATASPRVGEYDYGTKEYSPAEYYGDHYMYRDDPNLLPVKKGMYASYSPYPSQNALTAYPPPTLYSPHQSSSYSQNWSPAMAGGCACANMGYLGSSSGGSDLDMLNDLESGEVGVIENEGGGFVEGIVNWWNSLDQGTKDVVVKTGKEAVDQAVKGGKSSGTGRGKPSAQFQERLDKMTSDQLSLVYNTFQKLPKTSFVRGILRQIRAETLSRIYDGSKGNGGSGGSGGSGGTTGNLTKFLVGAGIVAALITVMK